MFQLHAQLAADSIYVGDFPLCALRLINDVQYPWFVLVPRRSDITEIFELDEVDRAQLLKESCLLSQAIRDVFKADKLNVAALGNMVSQLHLHHIARYKGDPAWPAPVWGKLPAVPYDEDRRNSTIEAIKGALSEELTYSKADHD